ncbi:hypothetical protein [Dokdonella sp.]|uniref:hypothetical protein n=1 Tax=Dokdonella sp. TaxID=2291710 RepID=UPI003528CD7E
MYTVEEIIHGLKRSIEACSTFRTDLNRNRIGHALNILNSVSLDSDGGLKVTRDEVWTAMIESLDISYLHTFSVDVLKPVRKTLDRLPLGAFSYVNAGTDDQGRDIAFEIGTARWLAQAGGEISLGRPADVVATFPGYQLGVECKRVKKGRAIGSNLTCAANQIIKHRAKGHDHPFAIAVDLSRAVNPGSDIMVAADEDEAVRLIHLNVERLFRENSRFIRTAMTDVVAADVEAILFRVLVMIGDTAGKRISIGNIWRVQPVVPVDSERFAQFREQFRSAPGHVDGAFRIEEIEAS